MSPLIRQLTDAFRCLPGVGPKSAQRMVLHLLERNREGGSHLSACLRQAMEKVLHCGQCRTFCETPLCDICQSPRRDRTKLCIVENPAELFAIEQTACYSGLYFVLMGHLSPLDGIGPEELGLDILLKFLRQSTVQEIILATNPTVEGEATAHYIAHSVRSLGLNVTRIAHGVPLGGELEYVDGGTLSHALSGRTNLHVELEK